jgi:hypothetical protein
VAVRKHGWPMTLFMVTCGNPPAEAGWSSLKSPVLRITRQRPCGRLVNVRVSNDEVLLPYEPHPVSVNQEPLLLRRLNMIDNELHRPLTTKNSE